MSTDPLIQVYKGKCHGQVSINKRMIKIYDKNMVCQYLKLGMKYKIEHRNIVAYGGFKQSICYTKHLGSGGLL
jgi:hypothetical protein